LPDIDDWEGSLMTSSATARPAHPAVRVALIGGIETFCRAAAKLRGLITGAGAYRPELHYMRGAGPKWRERHLGARHESACRE
jgi:hypothetical protein